MEDGLNCKTKTRSEKGLAIFIFQVFYGLINTKDTSFKHIYNYPLILLV